MGYVFYYFLSNGSLPWQGVKCDDGRRRYVVIGKIKETTDITSLCTSHPWEFGVYLRYCKNLRFAQNPDYHYLKGLFRGCLKRHHWEEDYEFDWSRHKSKMTLYSNHCTPVSGQSPAVKKTPVRLGPPNKKDIKKMLDVEKESPQPYRRLSNSLPSSLMNW